jgi:hypothetical protein
VKILTGLYFGSFAVAVAWFIWLALAIFDVVDGKVSPWPLCIAALTLTLSKLFARRLLLKASPNG